jgi:hypothetical protein
MRDAPQRLEVRPVAAKALDGHGDMHDVRLRERLWISAGGDGPVALGERLDEAQHRSRRSVQSVHREAAVQESSGDGRAHMAEPNDRTVRAACLDGLGETSVGSSRRQLPHGAT